MTDRRQVETAIHRQLSLVWAAAFTAAQLPATNDPIEVATRVAARQRTLDNAAREILTAERRK